MHLQIYASQQHLISLDLKTSFTYSRQFKKKQKEIGGRKKKERKIKQRGEGERERLQIVSHSRKASVEVTGKLAHATSLIKEMFPSKTIN